MAPLFKVTLEGTFSEIFYVRAECDDFAIDIAKEYMLDNSRDYLRDYLVPFVWKDVEAVDDSEDINEDEVLE